MGLSQAMGEPDDFYLKWAEEETGKWQTREKVNQHLMEKKAEKKAKDEDEVKEDNTKKEEEDRVSGVLFAKGTWFESHAFLNISLCAGLK